MEYKRSLSHAYLSFTMGLPPRPVKHLVTGKLYLYQDSGTAGEKFAASSGCPRFQFIGAETLKGRGQIPSPVVCGKECFKLQVNPVNLSHVRGIEGNGYPILPFNVNVSGEIERGDFLIHADRNAPGSAGCIVITLEHHWNTFEQRMRVLNSKGYQYLDLLIDYKSL